MKVNNGILVVIDLGNKSGPSSHQSRAGRPVRNRPTWSPNFAKLLEIIIQFNDIYRLSIIKLPTFRHFVDKQLDTTKITRSKRWWLFAKEIEAHCRHLFRLSVRVAIEVLPRRALSPMNETVHQNHGWSEGLLTHLRASATRITQSKWTTVMAILELGSSWGGCLFVWLPGFQCMAITLQCKNKNNW